MVDHEVELSYPDRYAIPVLARPTETEYYVATAFLGHSKGVTRLYTAAHVPTNRHPEATPGWRGWPFQIGVFPDCDAEAEPVDLFIMGTIPAPTPRFRWKYEPLAQPPRMMDAMSFDQFALGSIRDELEANYEVVDLDRAVDSPAVGDVFTCSGYPGAEMPSTKWPYNPPARRSGSFVRANEYLLQANFLPIEGFSGGPVTTADGAFVGMVVGSNADPAYATEIARIIPGSALRAL